MGPVVRKVDIALADSDFFKLSKIVHFLVLTRLKFSNFKLKFRFIHDEFDICSLIAFQALLRRLKKSLSAG